MQSKTAENILNKMKNGLVVSCQASGDSPFNSPEGVTMFAKAAMMGGAAGIRSEGFAKTKMIQASVNLPIIGLIKSEFEDGYVRITGTFNDVEKLIEAGSDIIAIDGTFRIREGLTGAQFITAVKSKYDCIIMADIAEYEEGLACIKTGADCLSTTLSGYTPETENLKSKGPDLDLLKELSAVSDIPVFAEGRINTPADAAMMIKSGAWAVVAGTAITRPNVITEWYVKAIDGVAKK